MTLIISRCNLLAILLVCYCFLEQQNKSGSQVSARNYAQHRVSEYPSTGEDDEDDNYDKVLTDTVRPSKESASRILPDSRQSNKPLVSKGSSRFSTWRTQDGTPCVPKNSFEVFDGASNDRNDNSRQEWSANNHNVESNSNIDYISKNQILPSRGHAVHIKTNCLPSSCSLDQVEFERKNLRCVSAHFGDVFPEVLVWYHNIIGIDITCIPQDKTVYLNSSYFVNSSQLKILGLFSCRIATIEPRTFAGLPNLEFLRCDVLDIHKLGKSTFEGLESLKNLSIFEVSSSSASVDDDKVVSTRFPNFLTGLTNLTWFLFSNLGVDAFTHSPIMAEFFTDQAHSLVELGVKHSELSNRHLYILRPLRELRDLDLRNNRLGYIQADSFPELVNTALRLEHNNIMFIEVDSFRRMENVTIELQGNPFNCECNNAGFSQWIRKYRSNASENGVTILGAESFKCAGPLQMYDKLVMDYDPYWWDCSPYVPLVALVFIVGFAIIVASISMIVYCNWVNLRYWLLERRVAAEGPGEFDEHDDRTRLGSVLPHGGITRNSLRQGKTGAYVIYDFHDKPMLSWANKFLDDNLHLHPMKIDLQWPAGPEVSPLWKQIKDFSFQVHFFLVLVNDAFLKTHWPEIAEKSGVENIMKLVLVVFGKNKRDLPKELRRLQCPCLEWPETGSKFNNLERCRDLFWKELRLSLKCVGK